MKNRIATSAGLSLLMSYLPHGRSMKIAGWVIVVLTSLVMLGGIGLYYEAQSTRDAYQEHTSTQTGTVINKKITRSIIDKEPLYHIFAQLGNEEIEISRRVFRSTYHRLQSGDTVAIVVPDQAIRDYHIFQITSYEDLGINIDDEDSSEQYQRLRTTVREQMTDAQQQFAHDHYEYYQLQESLDTQVQMMRSTGLITRYAICALLMSIGIGAIIYGSRAQEKHGDLNAHEIRAKRTGQ